MMSDTSIARDQLRTVVERIERLEEEKKAIADDIRDVYAEAKGNGFDVKTIRTVVRLRKLEPSERQEQEAMLDLYLSALGMLPPDDRRGDDLPAMVPDVGTGKPGGGSGVEPERLDGGALQ